jgi:multiple sugar transport system substrate-binding protein
MEVGMRLRLIVAVAASMLLSAALAACGSGGSQGAGGKTLTYWATNQGLTVDHDTKVLMPELQKFEQQTGTKVNLEVIPWSDLYNRILAAVSSGQGPDVLNIGNTWSASLQATGAFLPFDDATLGSVGGKAKFVPTALASTGAAGKTPTGVPLYSQAYALFYNKKSFAEAGIEQPPATWEEFLADAKKLTVHGDGKPDRWGVTIQGASVPALSHFAFFFGRQEGGSLFDASGAPTFDNNAEVAAVRRYIDLMAVHHVIAPNNAEYSKQTDDVNDFATGKAAMMLKQSNTRGQLAKVGFSDYGVAKMPIPAVLPPGGKDTRSMVAGTNISVFANTSQKDASLKLVNFLTSPSEQAILCKQYGLMPAVQQAYDDPDFSDPGTQVFKQILVNHAEPMPQIPKEGQMETLLGGALKELFAKAAAQPVSDADIRAALKSANEQMKAAG